MWIFREFTMYIFFIGLFLVALHVTCDGAPERSFPVPQRPADVFQEEKHIEKRTLCTDDERDISDYCGPWVASGFCVEGHIYYSFMQTNCYASCGNCEIQLQPTPVPQVDDVACLQAHNVKRALHEGTSPLVWNATLAQDAKDWADHLASIGKLQHASNTGQGENLYWASGSAVKSCEDAVESWYGEVSDYPFGNPPNSIDISDVQIGHFTQVVWKATTHVGAGLKKIVNSDGQTETYVVARYSPGGNIPGQIGDNVGAQSS